MTAMKLNEVDDAAGARREKMRVVLLVCWFPRRAIPFFSQHSGPPWQSPETNGTTNTSDVSQQRLINIPGSRSPSTYNGTVSASPVETQETRTRLDAQLQCNLGPDAILEVGNVLLRVAVPVLEHEVLGHLFDDLCPLVIEAYGARGTF